MRSPPESGRQYPGVLVIGIGNLLRGDDAAGPFAARELRRRGFRTLDVHQLTPELAEPVSRARRVIFIDSSAELAAGEVRREALAEGAGPVLEHTASPGAVLRLARQVYGAAPEAVLISIGAQTYELGRPLSDPVRRAIQCLLTPGSRSGI